MATELELKLYCAPEALAHLEAHPLISAGAEQGTAQHLESTTFDTPGLALQQERIALRLRTTSSGPLQTVSWAAKPGAALSARPTQESQFAGTFDFSRLDAGKVRKFLEERHAELLPVFTTTFTRRSWRVDVSKKIAILVMLDQGQISSGETLWPICEVKLALAQGKPEDLLDFAIALTNHLRLMPHAVSKAERGYRLFLNQQDSPQKAPPSPLHCKQTSAEAFHLLATQGRLMWQANLLGSLTSSDQEFIHQFRVSLRRLNSLLKVFKPALPERFERQWTKRLKALSQMTGDLRDLEVMQNCILQPILQSQDTSAQARISSVLLAHEEARLAAVAQIQQLGFGGPILLFVRELQELATDDFTKNLPAFAEKQLSGLHRNALKRLVKTLKAATPENAHRFRIALKHLRYASEFFAPLFDNEEMTQYAKTIANLQDELGFINDFHVSLSRLQIWVDRGNVPKSARETIAAWHSAQAQQVLASALHLAESVLRRCLPWCTECERRGLSDIRRRLKHEITLKIE